MLTSTVAGSTQRGDMSGFLESLLISAAVLLVELAVRALIRQVRPALLAPAI
jgi:hypothetical protein